jgi:hypothetical protein
LPRARALPTPAPPPLKSTEECAKDGAADAWVFDVDEMMLSKLPYYAQHRYG